MAWAADDKKPDAPAADEVAVIKFKDFGELVVEFWPDVAPKTVENFKKLAKDKFYDGTASHRLIAGFMLQMGDPLTKDAANESRWGTGDPGYKIKAEFNPKPHVRGVLSMARSRNPDSAGSQFFVCFAPAPNLDNQYTGFGKVIKGEDVLAKLEKIPVTDNKYSGEHSAPAQRVHVDSIRIVSRASLK
ncbi:MAG: peptidylprolyl isomerase [Verrucomicrobia bacterium]|nr:MAG: peptidylprolyl isomerase [Verrucomicrobiota bacterium]